MRVLVTGGAGFIGSHVVRKVLDMGHDVWVMDDLRHGLRSNIPEKAGYICMDINSPLVGTILARGNFDAIIHLAAQTRVDTSLNDPQLDTHENVMGTVHLLEGARQAGIRRIVFASSAAVYGNPPEQALPLAETYRGQPVSFYGLSKGTAEAYLQLYQQQYGLEYVILRFANVYGERKEIDDEGGVINVFAKRAAAGLPITIYGDGRQSRDYIYVGDIVASIIAALYTSHVNEVYNLSTGTAVTLEEVLAMIRYTSQKEIQPVMADRRSGDIYHSVLSSHKAAAQLDWQPAMTLANGIARTYQYYLSGQYKQ